MTLIIAEAGVNHNGDQKIAMDLIDAAHQSGADIVKFQTFKSENIATQFAKQAKYQQKNLQKKSTQLEMLKSLELQYEFHYEIEEHCKKLGIEFLSTAFDFDSLNFLSKSFNFKRYKIPSGEINNGPFLLEHAKLGNEIILSTGMASVDEIQAALEVIAFGYLNNNEEPTLHNFRAAYQCNEGIKKIREKVTLLHCTSEYPAPLEEVNLRAMLTLHDIFGLPVGYSDHSEGIFVPIAAASLGATVIEKHFTLDKKMTGPDHKISLEPHELSEMIKGIRSIETALGSSEKKPTQSEIFNKARVRKSLVALRTIKKGEAFSINNLAIKRPGNGISPFYYWELIGKISNRDYKEGELILKN